MVHKLNEYPNSMEVILLLLFEHVYVDSGIKIFLVYFLTIFISFKMFDFFLENIHFMLSYLYANNFEFKMKEKQIICLFFSG